MKRDYIDEKTFGDFKDNFHLLIETFNHSITDLKTSSSETARQVGCMARDLGEIKGSLKVTSKIVWWILGIMGVLIGAGCISQI